MNKKLELGIHSHKKSNLLILYVRLWNHLKIKHLFVQFQEKFSFWLLSHLIPTVFGCFCNMSNCPFKYKFFSVSPPKESIFFDHHLCHQISVIITHIFFTDYFFHDIDLLWAAFMYCIISCLSKLWVLLHGCCTSVFLSGPESHMFHFFFFYVWP